ncbi:MAG: nucleotidyltransferase family protein [Thermoanaerobaculia bacterium]
MAEAVRGIELAASAIAVVRAAALRHGMEAPRVFGSVARGEGSADSDLDLLVRMGPGRGYADLLAFCDDLEAKLGRKVDVLTEDALNPFLHRTILAEAIAL